MKKIISILMIMVMLVSVFAIPVFADDNVAQEYKYYDKMVELNYNRDPWEYVEIYYHYSVENNENPDWSLIYAMTDDAMDWNYYGVVVGERIIRTESLDRLSHSRYYVYVTELDKVIPLDNSGLDEILEHCPEFTETLDELNFGQLIGDINDDNIVNIKDVTYIQRMLAQYEDKVYIRYYYPTSLRKTEFVETADEILTDNMGNGKWKASYISDFNRDGETTILDATAIQRKIAKLD